jgi:hypothetical protein
MNRQNTVRDAKTCFWCDATPLTHKRVSGLQHEDSRQLLTKYSHEKTYRLRESLAQEAASESSPLPTFDAVDSTIVDAPK